MKNTKLIKFLILLLIVGAAAAVYLNFGPKKDCYIIVETNMPQSMGQSATVQATEHKTNGETYDLALNCEGDTATYMIQLPQGTYTITLESEENEAYYYENYQTIIKANSSINVIQYSLEQK